VVHSFGRADRLDRAALERLVRSIRRVLEADAGAARAEEKGRAGAIAIEASFELGVVHVVEQLWARLGIGQAITARLAAQELQAPHAAALLAMAAQRLAPPGSKLACHQRWLDRVWLPAAKDLALDQLYRALDILAEHGDAIEQEVFWHSVDLFKLDVDLIFYDATTAWLECDEEDVASPAWRGLTFAPLRRRGHSKEGRDPCGVRGPHSPAWGRNLFLPSLIMRESGGLSPMERKANTSWCFPGERSRSGRFPAEADHPGR
jgi:hypothetical protein